MNYRLKLALSCILIGAASAPAFGANLLDVYQRALQADPSIREADANRLAAREAKPQAWAALLPQIDASGSYGKTKLSGTSESVAPVPGTSPPEFIPVSVPSSSDGTSTGYSATLRQSIFRWGQWVELSRADAQVAQAEATYRAAEQDLIVRVIVRYFNVLYAKDLVDTNEAALNAFSRQLEQNEKRFEVGLIAITDVQESRAQRDRASANLIDAKRTLATNRELLRELTGEEFEVLAAPGADMPLNPPNPAAIDKWISDAMEQNLSLIAARLNAEIASTNVSSARAGHYPTLDFTASKGNTQSDTDSLRSFTSSSVETDTDRTFIGLQINIPIFSGGFTQSRVRQSVYLQRAARERVERVTRETERSVRDNYLGVMSNISRVQALKQAVESSQTSLQATQAGFEVGTRTTVDVLEAQRQLYASQAEYYRSRYDYLQTRVQLELAAGSLTGDDLATINGYLQP